MSGADERMAKAYRAASKWQRFWVHFYLFALAAGPILGVLVPIVLILGWDVRPVLALAWLVGSVAVVVFRVSVVRIAAADPGVSS